HRHGRLGDEPQQRVEVRDRHEPPRDVQQRVEVAPAGTLAAFGLAALASLARLTPPLLGGAPLSLTAIEREPAHDGSSCGICASTGPTLSAIRSRSIWSRRSNGPLRLLRTCSTPMTARPFGSHTGTTSMLSVRNPLRRSTLRSNRRSAYASGTLIVSPVRATCPAMPVPSGRRISIAVRAATRDQSSFLP